MSKKSEEAFRANNFKNLTPQRRSEIAAMGGTARQEQLSMTKSLTRILNLPVKKGAAEDVADGDSVRGLDKKNLTAWDMMALKLVRKGLKGDVPSTRLIAELTEKHEEIARGADEAYRGIRADLIAPGFSGVYFDVREHGHTEYVFPGGRGSTKSSFVSLCVIDILMRNPDINACVLRSVGNTVKDSVYAQLLWAIHQLELDDAFTSRKSPFEITRTATGQKIYFRGADDPNKIKSIKPEKGYIGVLWFEELDQFAGEEAVRKIEQSAIRGGDIAYIFKSFNPPKSALNWANLYVKHQKETRLTTMSDYRSVPKKWLGQPFLDEAAFLREINPKAYENEYLGVANGSGGNVFDNVELQAITDEEIARFDRVYRGVDWGWYPDPFHYAACYFDSARLTLYIFDEYRCNKQGNEQTARYLQEHKGADSRTEIICDSAENKSIADYKSYGIAAKAARKPPGSVDYSMKWLQSLRKIVIDERRCPFAAKEFLEYEYDRDRAGNVISGYPDRDNHAIDAVRYATNRLWMGRNVGVLK